jgi:hypothetical protein
MWRVLWVCVELVEELSEGFDDIAWQGEVNITKFVVPGVQQVHA